MFFSFWRKLQQTKATRQARRRRENTRRSEAFRPAFEALEKRELFATAVWSGADVINVFPSTSNSGPYHRALWSDANNWVAGYRPQNGDDIIFPAGTPKFVSPEVPLNPAPPPPFKTPSPSTPTRTPTPPPSGSRRSARLPSRTTATSSAPTSGRS